MPKYGKWLGGGLGWVLGGPIGGLIGFAFGSLLDEAEVTVQRGEFATPERRQNTGTGDFSVSLLVLSAAVMKADGATLKSELEFVREFFTRQFGREKAKEQMLLLREILGKNIPLRDVCLQIRQYMPMAGRLQLIHYLFGLAKADGKIEKAEMDTIRDISGYLGLNQADYDSLKAMYYRDSGAFYRILEITESASNEEVKKAYRRMAVKFHPDKVASMGEDVQKAAKEKFQMLHQAYEGICHERGIR